MKFILGLIAFLTLCTMAFADQTSRVIQDYSVTIKANGDEGSGVIITRELKGDDGKNRTVNFVLTAGHVVEGLRSTREFIDNHGTTRKVVEFKDAAICKELNKDGRRVGEVDMDVKVIKYSDKTDGEDLALLMVVMDNFLPKDHSAIFYLDAAIPEPGTDLYHCGSLLGQMGANSMTKGIVSQVGRIWEKHVYDQTTVSAFPGSSGGGVFIKDKDGNPLYVGMITRGSGETFNLMVPVRRIRDWARRNKVEWVLDPKLPTPTLVEVQKLSKEDVEGLVLPDTYNPNLRPTTPGPVIPIPSPPVSPHGKIKTMESNNKNTVLKPTILEDKSPQLLNRIMVDK
jgi:hypothetical protein